MDQRLDGTMPRETLSCVVMANPTTAQQGLFREQSLRARDLAWQGRPALTLGWPAAFTTFAAAALVVATAALVIFGNYARRVDLQGTVLPNTGLITVFAPSAGRIESLAVEEGEQVDRGTALYTIDVDTATKDGTVQQLINNVLVAERELLTEQIDRKSRMSEETQKQLRQKINNLDAQIDHLAEQIVTQQGFFKTISDEYNMFRGLLEQRRVSLNEYDARQQAWMQAQSKLQELESNRLRLSGELSDAQYQLATNGITTSDEIDALRAKISEINEKLATGEARRSIEVRAPSAGIVTAIVGHPGQVAGTATPMLKIVPRHTSMQAELLAPSSAIGFIAKGERVLLRYSAFPYQKFGEYLGTVATVSHAALSPDEVQGLLAGAAPVNQTGPFYRVIVEPDSQSIEINGEDHPLPASMQVQAYVLLDRRPLYQWILEPLYDIARAAHAT
jgi:membrane fusion protein